MDSFYFFSIILLSAGAFAGYRLGFIRIIFFVIQLAAATTTAYFSYSFIAGKIISTFPGSTAWMTALIFSFIFLIVFVLLYFLFSSVYSTTGKNSLVLLNKMAGALTGITAGCMLMLAMIRLTSVVTIPQTVESTIDMAVVDAYVDPPAAWVNNELLNVFKKPAVTVMASEMEDSVSHDAVLLPYTTDIFEARTDIELQMLQMINSERKKYGLKPLADDLALDQVARAHSADMFRRGYFSHNTPEGADPFQRLRKAKVKYRFAGENLALAQTLIQAHKELMRSPGHRANILNPSYGRVGIGILQAGVHGLMITQEFRD